MLIVFRSSLFMISPFQFLFKTSKSTTSRCPNLQRFSRLDGPTKRRRQHNPRAVGLNEHILTRLSVFASLQSKRSVRPPVADDGNHHRREEPVTPDDAVPAVVFTRSATAGADREFLQADVRPSRFDDLGIGDPRVSSYGPARRRLRSLWPSPRFLRRSSRSTAPHPGPPYRRGRCSSSLGSPRPRRGPRATGRPPAAKSQHCRPRPPDTLPASSGRGCKSDPSGSQAVQSPPGSLR